MGDAEKPAVQITLAKRSGRNTKLLRVLNRQMLSVAEERGGKSYPSSFKIESEALVLSEGEHQAQGGWKENFIYTSLEPESLPSPSA